MEISVLLEAMGSSVLKNAAVKMARVHLWMEHVIALLATQVHTVISHVQQAQLGSTVPSIVTVLSMEPVISSLENASK